MESAVLENVKSYHVHRDILEFLKHFDKLHRKNVNDTKIKVYNLYGSMVL